MAALEPSSLYMCSRLAPSVPTGSWSPLKGLLDSAQARLIIVPPGGRRDHWGVPACPLERASQQMRRQVGTLVRGFRWGGVHGK